MALKPCVECGKLVSDVATACPHCGHPNPTTPKTKSTAAAKPQATWKESLAGFAVLATLVAITVTMCSDGDEEKAAKAAEVAKADAACKKDLQCIGDKLAVTASVYCVDPVEKLAKNSMKWTDGTLETKFSRFRWKDASQTTITMLGDRAQFQNGFGAFINVVYECDLDVDSRRVSGVRVSEGRL